MRGNGKRLVRAFAWGVRGASSLALALVVSVPAVAQTVENPRRLAQGRKGQVLVADRSGSVVAIGMSSLEPVWSFQLPDEGAPFGLACRKRRLYVGNTETENVEVYRLQGRLSGMVKARFEFNLGGTPPGQQGSIRKPIDIGFDSNVSLLFVLDGGDKTVKIFDLAGTQLGAFVPSDENGEVLSPVSLAVDEVRREVLVGDYGDPSGSFRTRDPARILIYDYSGTLLFQIDGDGSTHEATQFARIQGMATSPDGRIFAADPLASRILELDRLTGELLTAHGGEGQEPGQLMLPLDVLLHAPSGDVYVSNNRGARRIEVFRGVGR